MPNPAIIRASTPTAIANTMSIVDIIVLAVLSCKDTTFLRTAQPLFLHPFPTLSPTSFQPHFGMVWERIERVLRECL